MLKKIKMQQKKYYFLFFYLSKYKGEFVNRQLDRKDEINKED
jgi:hypothetical protein